MISRFFIDRPIFACVISILITLAGLVSLRVLPIAQYPNITPPQIQVITSYTGADAETVAQLVAAPIEQQINGVENMIYMYSQNSSSGDMSLDVFFDIGTDADMAQINVQNRVNMALPLLPEEIQKTGVTVKKQTPNILLIVAVQSPDGRYDDIYTSNYASINIVDELRRLRGISDVSIIGGRDYSMRLWLRPDKMTQLGFAAGDIVNAVREQNAQFAVGRIGSPPNTKPVEMQLPITTKGRLSEPEEFDDIILRANANGSFVQLKDVGHAELGAVSYDIIGELNGVPTTLIAVYQQYGANALSVAEDVKRAMEDMSRSFPSGITYTIPYDTTKFVKTSITEVSHTIWEAALLVFLCVLIFLQNMRATLIPLLAMLVSIIGTFVGMYALGFSINTLTLFGLVLAIGTVVDDAIVVIENVERNMREKNMSGIDAAKHAMDEVTGPVIAIVFVLCAVFVPVAFLGGIAGQLYKQFAITITVSVIISGIVALTLSPALAASMLKVQSKGTRIGEWFNRGFERFNKFCVDRSAWLIKRQSIALLTFGGLVALLLYLFHIVPQSFVPDEDQGYLMILVDMPDGASLERTQEVSQQVSELVKKVPAIEDVLSFAGFGLLEGLPRPNKGAIFVILKDWEFRKTPEMQASAAVEQIRKAVASVDEARVLVFNPPPIQGMGMVGGFEFWIENRGSRGAEGLETTLQEFLAAAKKRPELGNMAGSVQANSMQLYIDLDRYKARALGVSISDVFQALQILLGSLYINDFNKFGRVYRVVAQAEPYYRASISDIGEVYVRSNKGDMIPLKSLLSVKFTKGPTLVSRFNGFMATKINGAAAPGYSSGQAMQAMEEVALEVLPDDMGYAWSGQSFQEKATGGTSGGILAAGLVVVFLILAALYERWSLPIAILLAAPFGILGAIFSIWLRGISNDVYFQVGLVALIALAAKNAILIVEFAVIKKQEGLSTIEAAIEATRMRFRAILMTSLTFIFGVLPLAFSSGAGSASRHSVGTGVLGGMIAATLLAILFVPLFYALVERYCGSKESK